MVMHTVWTGLRGTVVAVGLLVHGAPHQAPVEPRQALDKRHEQVADWLRHLPAHVVTIDQVLAQMAR